MLIWSYSVFNQPSLTIRPDHQSCVVIDLEVNA